MKPEKIKTPCPYPYVAVGPLACRGCDTLAEALGVAAETGATVYGRLDAAAPDLLAACEALLTPRHTPETYDAALDALRAALAKARGA
jgi:hypothetical protein